MYSEKFKMFETLGESFGYLKDNFGKYVANSGIIVVAYFVSVAVMVSVMLNVFTSFFTRGSFGFGTSREVASYMMGRFASMFLVLLPVILFFIVLFAVYIKITDDVYEKRNTTYGEKFKYVFKRVGRILLSNLMVYILAFVVVFVTMPITLNAGRGLLFLYNILLNFVFCLFIMINQSIIIEDTRTFEAIKRSIEVMKPNVFKYVGFTVVISIISIVGGLLLQLIISQSMILAMVSNLAIIIIAFILMPIPMIFMTLLFKNVPHKPWDYQSASDHYIESDDLYFEHDSESNEGLYTDDKDLYYDE